MSWLPILAKVLPVILLLGAGVLVRRTGFLAEATVAELKKLVVNLALPALLFTAFLRTDFQPRYAWIIAVTFAVNLLMLLLGKACGLLLARGNPYFPLLFTGFEMGMMGFSLFGTAYGLESLSTFGIFDLGQELYVWFVLTTLLGSLNRAGAAGGAGAAAGAATAATGPARVLRSFLSSPVILAILLAVALNLGGLGQPLAAHPLGGALLGTLGLVSQLTIPLVLLVIGYQLNFRAGRLRLPLATLALRTALLVGLAFLVDRLLLRGALRLPPLFSAALFTMFVLPPPFIIPLFMQGQGADSQDYVSNTLSLATVVSLAAFVAVVVAFP